MSIPGNVFDCQPARRDLDELHNNSRNLITSVGVQRTEGIEKSGSEEPLKSIPLPCFQGRAGQTCLDGGNRPYVYDKLSCCGYWVTIPSYPSAEIHLGKFPELDCELPNRSVLEGEKSLRSHCSGSRKSKQPNRRMTSSLPNQ